ncbi:PREDICTED: tRNA-dihydrouridine(16/17) synthase [NAD(P)(+)]-like [Camelina sativa]|uniref:tRNA-dihydrouridine(16/17) synthase [NAD(P)(+)]-like n=1 Tax=Camelina sativa TaxID=90675 RepID=A0ABM0TU23_CAMSA|nr:PREDICTED: tRNA-dihydrouridine(16/17) synthase [NAD(P)(+)]-like [Camelina sativa]
MVPTFLEREGSMSFSACPQRIARRGNYGAFLIDNLPLVKSPVEKLAQNLNVPVSCKIRISQTFKIYAKMLEDAGCSLLAVHGRTRDEKPSKEVKDALRIPVLANGNVRCIEDVDNCIEETGVEGVLSAETLLENPAVFDTQKLILSGLFCCRQCLHVVFLFICPKKLKPSASPSY